MHDMKGQEDNLFTVKDQYFRLREELESTVGQYNQVKSYPQVDAAYKDKLFW